MIPVKLNLYGFARCQKTCLNDYLPTVGKQNVLCMHDLFFLSHC